MKQLVFSFLLVFSASASAGLFGYYHVDSNGALPEQNLVYVQAANPNQSLVLTELYPEAKIVFEFSAARLVFRGQEGCEYNKCHVFDPTYSPAIVGAVAEALKDLNPRMAALYIADEIETNPPTLNSMVKLIAEIKKYPELRDIPLWVNFDNVYSSYSGTPFVIPEGLDIISLTPNYGKTCFGLCESGRVAFLLAKAAEYNRTHVKKLKWMVVGDAWSAQPGADEVHLAKIRPLYESERALAAQHGVEVLGALVFTWSEPRYALQDSAPAVREAWASLGREIMGESVPNCPPLPSNPIPSINLPGLKGLGQIFP